MTRFKSEFCECNGFSCPCGKSGAEILKCRKPFTLERIVEILKEMHDLEMSRQKARLQ